MAGSAGSPGGAGGTRGEIVVVDYGRSNLRSVAKAVERVAAGRPVLVSGRPEDVAAAERVVFPGQGAMGDCMREIDRLGLREVLVAAAREKPFLGICLGLQSLVSFSEEDGGTTGLGLFPGRVARLLPGADPVTGERRKIPHMGWNEVRQVRPHPLWAGIADGTRFYFVHSYHVVPDDQGLVVATTDYGGPLCAALAQGGIFACQFHPEKSQAAGLRLLENFLAWAP
jgi:glutamine amidotransferase